MHRDGTAPLLANREDLFPIVGAPSAGSVGRGSWCCESGRRNPGNGYFPTPGSHLTPLTSAPPIGALCYFAGSNGDELLGIRGLCLNLWGVYCLCNISTQIRNQEKVQQTANVRNKNVKLYHTPKNTQE